MKYPFLDLKQSNAPYMDELCKAAERVVRGGRYVGGPEITRLEDKLCRLTGSRYAVAVSNGLDSLRLILRAYIELGEMAPGDEILVAANTYIASFLAISDAGLVPVAVDIDAHTFNIDTSKLEQAISPRTRGIMTVHLYGRVAWDEKIKEIAQRYGLKIIEDNAQAIGAESEIEGLEGGRITGNLGNAAGFSFYPTKNVGALGDAGAVTTNDERLANTVRALANYGADVRYHNLYNGFNCRMDPIQAAMLSVKLNYLEEENELRRRKAEIYNREIKKPELILPEIEGNGRGQVWHQYVVRVKGGKRDDFRQWLEESGVGTDIHYAVPAHLQPCYTGLKHDPLPVTEQIADEILSLPIGRGTSETDVQEIAAIINNLSFVS